MTLLRESAAECLCEIVSKGMEPLPKIDLVESLNERLRNLSILSLVSEKVCTYIICSKQSLFGGWVSLQLFVLDIKTFYLTSLLLQLLVILMLCSTFNLFMSTNFSILCQTQHAISRCNNT